MNNEAYVGSTGGRESTVFDQIGINDGIKQIGIDAVVQVMVHVIVGPGS
jgi:hypothetical protein